MKVAALTRTDRTIGLTLTNIDWIAQSIRNGDQRLTLILDKTDLPDLVQACADALDPGKEQ